MAAEPSKEEQQRRLDAVDAICEPILYEARTRGRADLVRALHEVSNEVSSRIMELMSAMKQAERDEAKIRKEEGSQ
ncbi:hypothetical protein ES702_06402 [subsurface metagenome]